MSRSAIQGTLANILREDKPTQPALRTFLEGARDHALQRDFLTACSALLLDANLLLQLFKPQDINWGAKSDAARAIDPGPLTKSERRWLADNQEKLLRQVPARPRERRVFITDDFR